MSLVRTLFGVAKPAWFLVVMGTSIAVYSGQAEPFVSSTQVPRSPEVMFGSAVVAIVVGLLVIGTIEWYQGIRSWRAAGRQAELSPAGGGGVFGRSDLTGTVDGRRVRARTVTRKQKSGGDESTRQRYTIVEADLNRPAEGGVLVAPAGGGRVSAGSITLDVDVGHVDDADDGLVAVEGDGPTIIGNSEAAVQVVRSGRAGNALRDLDGVNAVYVGNAGDVVSAYLQDLDMAESGLGSLIQRKMTERAEGALTERVPGDPTTVSAETVGLVLDGDELRRQVEVAAAIADAFEQETTRT